MFCGWCGVFVDSFVIFLFYFYGMKTLECVGISGFFGVFVLLTVSAFG